MSSQYMIDSDDLNCPICFNTLGEDCRTLWCQHSFCENCLHSIEDRQYRRIQCPLCHKVTRRTTSRLDKNFLLVDILRNKRELSATNSGRTSYSSIRSRASNSYSSNDSRASDYDRPSCSHAVAYEDSYSGTDDEDYYDPSFSDAIKASLVSWEKEVKLEFKATADELSAKTASLCERQKELVLMDRESADMMTIISESIDETNKLMTECDEVNENLKMQLAVTLSRKEADLKNGQEKDEAVMEEFAKMRSEFELMLSDQKRNFMEMKENFELGLALMLSKETYNTSEVAGTSTGSPQILDELQVLAETVSKKVDFGSDRRNQQTEAAGQSSDVEMSSVNTATIPSNILECPVCFENMDEFCRTLWCQHTFCDGCLRSIEDKKLKQIECPMCHKVTKRKTDKLSRNFKLVEILKHARTATE